MSEACMKALCVPMSAVIFMATWPVSPWWGMGVLTWGALAYAVIEMAPE